MTNISETGVTIFRRGQRFSVTMIQIFLQSSMRSSSQIFWDDHQVTAVASLVVVAETYMPK